MAQPENPNQNPMRGILSRGVSIRTALAACAALLVLQALVLVALGQPPICTCGYVKLWEGVVKSSGNSQHLSDWYTFSPVIHGFAFYLLTWAAFRKAPVSTRLALAIGLEAAWEIFENTPMVINHYRKQALAQGYIGDSIINSISDTIAMVFGFVLSWRVPVWGVVAMWIAMEAFVGYSIRDNLTLNIVNFIYPLDFIAEWQAGQ